MNAVILKANICTMGLNLVYAMVALLVGCAALKLMDKLLFPDIDFMAEIKRGNVASAIFFGMVLLFLAMVLSSAVR